MNLELQDTFVADCPEVIDAWFADGHATTCRFNRRGTLLAVGSHDGRCVVWDFDTHSVARVLLGHVLPVTALSWSSNGRKLLTSSLDWNVFLWDILGGIVEKSVRFECPVLTAQLHPKKMLCLACPFKEDPVVVYLDSGTRRVLPVFSEGSKAPAKADEKAQKSKITVNTVAASFDSDGSRILTGNANGLICVFNTETLTLLYSVAAPGNAPIKSIKVSLGDGKYFLVNSTDKTMRVFQTDGCVFLREFRDVVSGLQWKEGCFSSDGDYVIGGSAQTAEHNIYIWSRINGRLFRMLEGPKEAIMDLVWHPRRPIIASVSSCGVVYIWSTNCTENWSAFAPGFKELEENEEYIEREDEFDILDTQRKTKQEINEDEDVDIMTIEGEEDEDELWFLPTAPERDNSMLRTTLKPILPSDTASTKNGESASASSAAALNR